MTIMEMLGQSGVLAVLGMSVVFGFLVIMIIAITVVGKIMQTMEVKGAAAPVKAAAIAPAVSGNDASVTAAIAAAVNEYRKIN